MLRIVHVLAWLSAAVAVWIASLRSGLPASQHFAVLCVRPQACSCMTPTADDDAIARCTAQLRP